MIIARKELLQTQAFFCCILHLPNFQEHFNKQNYLNNEIKSNISKTICILFIYGGFPLHFQRVFTSTLIFLNLKYENSSYKLHYNKILCSLQAMI
jgi:hypothetical protein